LINDAAKEICNTVEEAKGRKTEVEIQGDVSAKLSGLLDKFADVGASTGGKLSEERFEGLSRDATASALEGDRGCRERIFLRMFEELDRLPDAQSLYEKNGKRGDLRKVQNFIRYAPGSVVKNRDEYVCQGPDLSSHTVEININDGALGITNRTFSDFDRCPSFTITNAEELVECSAHIGDLDDVLVIWDSSYDASVNCLTGSCFNCKANYRRKEKGSDWTSKSRSYQIGNASIYTGSFSYYEQNPSRFNEFFKALSRLISKGSTEAFCARNPNFC
tara:strand:- start:173 stop:1000 length:828 start_codon:yes stop_codon:yes gene_type:complete